jgi:Mitochondrial carrier protein
MKSLFVAIAHRIPNAGVKGNAKDEMTPSQPRETSSGNSTPNSTPGTLHKRKSSTISLTSLTGDSLVPTVHVTETWRGQESKEKKFSTDSSSSSKRGKGIIVSPPGASTTMGYAWAALANGVAAAIAHPFYVLSARMATNSDYSQCDKSDELLSQTSAVAITTYSVGSFVARLAKENWIRSYFNIVSREGVSSLYNGVRISFGAAMLYSAVPLSMTGLFGLYESVFLRRIISQAGCLSAGKSFSGDSFSLILRSMVSMEGYMSLFRYGVFCTLQILPGFVTFVCSRYAGIG